jgi:cell division septation protein DedD
MLRPLFFFAGYLISILARLFAQDEISVTCNMPAQLKAGDSVKVEFVINKGGIAGFGAIHVELPEGVSILRHISTATITTAYDPVKAWEWAPMPEGSQLKLELVVAASSTASGIKAISAHFVYIEENDKQEVSMVPAEFEVIATEGARSTDTTSHGAEPAENIHFTRTYSVSPQGDVVVDLQIQKGGTKGFARYSDQVPAGSRIKAIQTDGASFSVSENKLRFVWVNVPDRPVLHIVYSIPAKSAQGVALDGEYAYIEHNQTRKFKLPAETVDTRTAVAAPVTGPSVTPVPKDSLPVENEKKKPVEKPVVRETPAAGIHYAVQVGAFSKKKVTAQRLKKKFRLSAPLRSEMSEGFTKFMTGDETEYKGARDLRDQIRETNRVKTAFVVAYNDGKRITVQEALMISKQKWYK